MSSYIRIHKKRIIHWIGKVVIFLASALIWYIVFYFVFRPDTWAIVFFYAAFLLGRSIRSYEVWVNKKYSKEED